MKLRESSDFSALSRGFIPAIPPRLQIGAFTGAPQMANADVLSPDPTAPRRRKTPRRTSKEVARDAARRMAGNFIRQPGIVPATELRDRANTVRFAGGEAVPSSNTCGAWPELVTVDPLSARTLITREDLLTYTNPACTMGKIPAGEQFVEWDIYSGTSETVEDEIIAVYDAKQKPPADIEEEPDLRDRVLFGQADTLDLITFLHLEFGISLNEAAKLLSDIMNESREVSLKSESRPGHRISRRKDYGKRKGYRKEIRRSHNETADVRAGKGTDQNALRREMRTNMCRANRAWHRGRGKRTREALEKLNIIQITDEEYRGALTGDWQNFLDEWFVDSPIIDSPSNRVVSPMQGYMFA